ncbi:hypothetical protein BDZ89DRAFT_760937 [Hymenopellis radicata]|nr:hypothetical protein BDZ89DRAFT_760937 [Hymenopellis radicata]
MSSYSTHTSMTGAILSHWGAMAATRGCTGRCKRAWASAITRRRAARSASSSSSLALSCSSSSSESINSFTSGSICVSYTRLSLIGRGEGDGGSAWTEIRCNIDDLTVPTVDIRVHRVVRVERRSGRGRRIPAVLAHPRSHFVDQDLLFFNSKFSSHHTQ